MDGHRNYELIRRRTIYERVAVLAPNEIVALRLANALLTWRETRSEDEEIVSVSAIEPWSGR